MGPPPDNLMALIEQASIKQVFQTPPNAFYIALMVSDVSCIKIDPESLNAHFGLGKAL